MFKDEELEVKEIINEMIKNVKEGYEIGKAISHTTNFIEWSELVSDSRFTIFAVGSEGLPTLMSLVERESFAKMGLDEIQNEKSYIKVIQAGSVLYTNSGEEEKKYEGIAGTEQGEISSNFIIENSNEELSIKIDGEEFSRQDEGINVVIYENDYHYVVDSVTLKCDEVGKIQIIR